MTVTVCELEVPPPGEGFSTVTRNVPPDATSASGIIAVSVVGETKVVARLEPRHNTVEAVMKPAPSTVITRPRLPASTVLGVTRVVTGAGLLTAKAVAPDVPPPGAGLKTVTLASAPVAMSALPISAAS